MIGTGKAVLAACCVAALAGAADRKTDPTFLHRFVPEVAYAPSDVTTATCRYKPVFGAGDADARSLRGIARFGEMIVGAGGRAATVSYPTEEQAYVVLEGRGTIAYGEEKHPIRANDFMYLAPGVPHAVVNDSAAPCRVVVMGFRTKGQLGKPAPLMISNMDDVRQQTVEGHPPSTLYQLLVGDVASKRDKIAAGQVLTSLFTMEFAPGGTNIPHHHETEEEMYLVLRGHGDMVAGGGMDGVEGRHPARAGDAYFFRLNCTVGFYTGNKPGEEKARILAVRSRFPFSK